MRSEDHDWATNVLTSLCLSFFCSRSERCFDRFELR